ncbi:MAG TPA: PD-(D/E)XK nuclease family protein [Bryobacteraceae bacterium]|nr:PD-(D/E)XK nuclease family protein [Bryobacteraceae bacterium]
MHLLTGPAGSGRTTFVLDRFREAVRERNDAVRLLVPTATMAQHLQNRIAREGFVFRRDLIQTFSGFVEAWASDLLQAPDSVLYLIVEDAARCVSRPEFARVVHMPGFCASLARIIGEFSSAGCDSARLARYLPEAPLSAAFLAVYQEVDRELAQRGLFLRARRLAHAADRIRSEGLSGIHTVWLDGFHALPDPELDVIGAMARHVELTLTFDGLDSRLAAMGFREERLPRVRPSPARLLVKAPSIEREVEDIARRILEQSSAGRPFREMGIIVRSQETYVPILRSTLERFGIPARFYFDSKLQEHTAIRFLSGAIDAMLGGWDHRQTLAALRLATRFADSNIMDGFEFDVRRQIPNSGLGALKAVLHDGAERLTRLIDALGDMEEWLSLTLGPREWAARLRTLRNLCGQDPLPVASHQMALEWRSLAAALDLFDEALDEAAGALSTRPLAPGLNERIEPMKLPEFWRAVKSVLRLKPLRLGDRRRNVVHVLSAPEARQWVLPVVFVCGMVEKEFPLFHRQDPYFPDAARSKLNAAGIRVRTAAEFEREERALFDSAITRATLLVTLSYPEFNSRGDRNLPSLFLEDLVLPTQEFRWVRPQPRHVASSSPAARPPALHGIGTPALLGIRTPALLDFLRQKTATLSPSALENYLQCPFQYFGGRLLRLKPAPDRPEERLDFLTQGNIVHEVLAAWWATRQNLEPLFERIFERFLTEKRIPPGYHTERLRNAMVEDLQAFANTDQWPRGGFASRMEEKFLFPLDDSLQISGKIDRLDVAPDGSAYVIDYKYSRAQRTKERLTDENLVQAPLYLMAAEKVFRVKPAGMFYIGLKGGIVYAGWNEAQVQGMPDGNPFPQEFIGNAGERTLQVVQKIRAGRIEVAPADADNCRFCDCRDVCRVETIQTAVVSGSGTSATGGSRADGGVRLKLPAEGA